MSYEMNSGMDALSNVGVGNLLVVWKLKNNPKLKVLISLYRFEPVQPLATLKILGCFRLCLLILAPHKMFLR